MTVKESKDKHEILFHNPVFHKGLNVTVRDGDKWMKVNIGDRLILKRSDRVTVVEVGEVVGKALLPATLIPESLLAYEHDPNCRNTKGVLAELKRKYPNFSKHDAVTVLLFSVH